MKRRDLFKAALGAGLYLTARTLIPPVLRSDAAGSIVAVAENRDYEKATADAIDLLGGIGTFVKPGDVVVVKPNIGWNSPPELKATTDPVVVRTIVDLCFKAMASTVYVFDRSCSNPKLAYVNSGIMEAAKSAGAKVPYVNDVSRRTYATIRIPDAVFLKETTIIKQVLEADVLINVPVAKSHSSATLTIGMKNLMGITGDNRAKWHWKLHDAISDVNMGVKSHLTVVDATDIMVKNGPTGGRKEYLKREDRIIASADIVSADAETAKLFGRKPQSIAYIRKAAERGVGYLDGYTIRTATL